MANRRERLTAKDAKVAKEKWISFFHHDAVGIYLISIIRFISGKVLLFFAPFASFAVKIEINESFF